MMKKFAWKMAAVLLALSLAGCQNAETGTANVENVGEICGIGPVGLIDRFAGMVVSEEETKIEKSNTVQIAEILVKAGDTVEEGQTLFTYDNTQLEFSIERAKLELEQMKLNLQSKIQSKEELEKEKEKAKESEQLAYSLEIRQLEAEIREEQYNITLKEKEIEQSEGSMDETSVESPVSGRVQAINKDGGFDDYGNPLPFMTIVQEGNYRVKGYINEANVAALPEGTNVLVRSRVNDAVWQGTVQTIDFTGGQSGNPGYFYGVGSEETGNSTRYPFYIAMADTEGLLLGQHVYIEPDYGQAEQAESTALMLPMYYLIASEDGTPETDADGNGFVYAKGADGRIEKRKVSLGARDEMLETCEILSGLTAEDYIAYPTDEVKVGMKCVTAVAEPTDTEPVKVWEGAK